MLILMNFIELIELPTHFQKVHLPISLFCFIFSNIEAMLIVISFIDLPTNSKQKVLVLLQI